MLLFSPRARGMHRGQTANPRNAEEEKNTKKHTANRFTIVEERTHCAAMQVSLAGGDGGVSNIIQLCITCGWSQQESVSCQNSQLRVLLRRLCRPHWLVGIGGGGGGGVPSKHFVWMVNAGEIL